MVCDRGGDFKNPQEALLAAKLSSIIRDVPGKIVYNYE